MKAPWMAALVLTSCNASPTGLQQAEDRTSASFAITPERIDPDQAASGPRGLSALSSEPSSFVDVASVRIDVKEKETGEFLHTDFELSPLSESWTGTLPQLPCGRRLTFHARAFDPHDTLLFSSTTDQTLDAARGDSEDVVLSLSSPHQDDPIPLPGVKKVFAPGNFEWGEPGNVSFTVQGPVGEELTFRILPAPGGGTFDPSSGTFTLEATTGTFVSRYNPPWVEGMTHFEHQVEILDGSGHAVTTTFRSRVKPSGKGTAQDTRLGVLVNPVINHLTAGRISGTGNVLWRAEVADDGPSNALSYSWSFTPEGSFDPVPSFTGDTNPTTLQHYTPAVRGTLKLEVTDGDGGRTTLLYPLEANQFPEQPVEAIGLHQLQAGHAHACVLIQDGTVRCWGRNQGGQLGHGHTNDLGDDEQPYTAGDVPEVGVATRLAVGGHHTCALLESGLVRCWGRNQHGQLGYGTTEDVWGGEALSRLGYVHLGSNAVKLAAGAEHTCALLDTGAVRCWGLNQHGQLGYGHTRSLGDDELPSSAGDVDVGGTVRELVAGGWHTCALLDTGAVRCWGRNDFGQLGYGHTRSLGDDEPPSLAGDISVGGRVLQLSAGDWHTCALLDTSAVRCWGLNSSGQLGLGHTFAIGNDELPSSSESVSVSGHPLQLSTGRHHTCALLSTGSLQCWGDNGHGQLGLGHRDELHAPPAHPVDLAGAAVLHVTTGASFTCALLDTGEVRCWGLNDSGQLGQGHTEDLGDDELPSTLNDIQLLTPG